MINLSHLLILVVTYKSAINIHEKYTMFGVDYIVIDNTPIGESIMPSLDTANQINNNKNLGVATALNIGAQYAIDHGYNWVITMDQDSDISVEIIQQMLEFANKQKILDDIAIISPRHVMQEGIMLYQDIESQEYIEGLHTMTSGNLLNLHIWQQIGGFTDELFIDMVDVDYYCKAMTQGYRVITLNKVFMPHSLGSLCPIKLFGKTFLPTHHNYIRRYYQVRNSLYVYFKYRKTIADCRFLRIFAVSQFVLVVLFEKDKLRKIRYMFKGLYDFMRGKFIQI